MNKPTVVVIAISLTALLGCGKKREQQPPERLVERVPEFVIRIVSVTGEATLTDTGGQTRPAAAGTRLAPGDILETGGESQVVLEMASPEDRVLVHENTSISAQAVIASNSAASADLKVPFGRIFVDVSKITNRGGSLKVRTPTAVAAIRGTKFEVLVDKPTGATEVSVVEGEVEVRDIGNQGAVRVGPSRRSRVEKDRKPADPIQLRKQELESIGNRTEALGDILKDLGVQMPDLNSPRAKAKRAQMSRETKQLRGTATRAEKARAVKELQQERAESQQAMDNERAQYAAEKEAEYEKHETYKKEQKAELEAEKSSARSAIDQERSTTQAEKESARSVLDAERSKLRQDTTGRGSTGRSSGSAFDELKRRRGSN